MSIDSEIFQAPAALDKVPGGDTPASGALAKLQASAGLGDGGKSVADVAYKNLSASSTGDLCPVKPGTDASNQVDIAYKHLIGEGGLSGSSLSGRLDDYLRHWQYPRVHYVPHLVIDDDATPTDWQRNWAALNVESGMSRLIPEEDRQAMGKIIDAITSGDDRAFAAALRRVAGDPEKIKELVEEVDQLLERKGCTTRLDVSEDGKVIVSDTERNLAVAFDPVRGTISGRAVEHNADGSMLVKPGEVVHTNVDKNFKEIGNRAVNAINHVSHSHWTYEPVYEPSYDPIYEPLYRPSYRPPHWYGNDPDLGGGAVYEAVNGGKIGRMGDLLGKANAMEGLGQVGSVKDEITSGKDFSKADQSKAPAPGS